MPPLPPSASMACSRTALPLPLQAQDISDFRLQGDGQLRIYPISAWGVKILKCVKIHQPYEIEISDTDATLCPVVITINPVYHSTLYFTLYPHLQNGALSLVYTCINAVKGPT
jgi:hypothetical protein